MSRNVRSRADFLRAQHNDLRDWLAIAVIVLASSLLVWLPLLAAELV